MNTSTTLLEYFRNTTTPKSLTDRIGMEVETSFVDRSGKPISVAISQQILRRLSGKIIATKGELITTVQLSDGSRVLYELGRQNLEISVVPYAANEIVAKSRALLDELYLAAASVAAAPSFSPILETDEDLLIVPDKRDANWLTLDGRTVLNLLASCSSVQFTVEVPFGLAVTYLQKLLAALPKFLERYPQESRWRRYISESAAGYLPDRYGGPKYFDSVKDYCQQLVRHDVICGTELVPYATATDFNIDLFLRSIWWYFRLRRYGNNLCLEIRPLPRLCDSAFKYQLQQVLECLL